MNPPEVRKYQVFVSSTYEDLQEHRRHVMQALLELDCFPAGMELFPSSDQESMGHYLQNASVTRRGSTTTRLVFESR